MGFHKYNAFIPLKKTVFMSSLFKIFWLGNLEFSSLNESKNNIPIIILGDDHEIMTEKLSA